MASLQIRPIREQYFQSVFIFNPIRARYFEISHCFFFCFLANQDGAFCGRFGPPFSSVSAASFAAQQKDGGKKSVL